MQEGVLFLIITTESTSRWEAKKTRTLEEGAGSKGRCRVLNLSRVERVTFHGLHT